MPTPEELVHAASGDDSPIPAGDSVTSTKNPTMPIRDLTTSGDAGRSDAAVAPLDSGGVRAATPELVEETHEVVVPRASGQPICAVVEEHGVARVHAFARRWRSYLYQHVEKRRSSLAPHDLCAMSCTGLTSRCLRMMEREGFLCAVRPPATPGAK